ncbi:MAG: phage protein Gp27 family protein [Sphingomonadales bacterium]|jgi:alkylhydroperoxidase/carboxymuconolactone decarboxylase family protein YurZ
MGRRSSLDSLSAEVREAVDVAIANRATIKQIVAAITAAGEDVSRSAVGRYKQKYAKLVERQRELRTVAKAWNQEAADPENPLARMMIQLAESDMTDKLMASPASDDPDEPVNWAEMEVKTRALRNLASAAKITAEREAAIRKNERERSAQVATEAAKKAGATPETIDLIKREILGIA